MVPRGALCRGVPDSFAGAVRSKEPDKPIDVNRAREQHANYVAALRRLLPGEVEVIGADESHPDCPFIEDTAVVVGKVALITQLGHPSRRGEEEAVARKLRELGYETQRPWEGGERLDGGDVLWTGEEIFVGLSSRTNEAGAKALQRAFSGVPVRRIQLQEGLHLKSVMTMLGPRTLAVAESDGGRAAEAQALECNGMHEAVRIPDCDAANVVLTGEGLMIRSECGEESKRALWGKARELGLKVEEVAASELAKADGLLTCCSILLP